MNKHKKQSKTTPIRRIESKFNAATDNNRVDKVRLITSGTISSSAGTIIATVINLNPSGASEWTSYSAIYDEFRVLGCRIKLISRQQGSVTNICNIVGIVFDNDDSTALTSVNAALEYDTAHVLPTILYHRNAGENSDPTVAFSWARPTGGKNTAINWIDVAAPTGSNGSVKFYATGASASTMYFDYSFEWFTEFRGRR